MHFGAALRLLRIDAGLALNDLARRIGVSRAYLSRVERGHDAAPTPDRVLAIARELDVPPLVLLELAQGTGTALSGYVERVPAAAALFLEIARRNLGPAEVARVREFLDRELPVSRPSAVRATRLTDLLATSRIVLDLRCGNLEDLVDVAAARLATATLPPRELAERILEREREGASTLGSGVAVPHAVVRGARPLAALVTLASPLDWPTPDGRPVRVAIAMVLPPGGRDHLETLAHTARLAARGLADVVDGARSTQGLLNRLEALDVL